jgi:hypothetical protein
MNVKLGKNIRDCLIMPSFLSNKRNNMTDVQVVLQKSVWMKTARPQ